MQLLLPSEDLAEAAEAKSEAVRRLEAAGQVKYLHVKTCIYKSVKLL